MVVVAVAVVAVVDYHKDSVVDDRKDSVVDYHRGFVVDVHRGFVVDFHRGFVVVGYSLAADYHKDFVDNPLLADAVGGIHPV